MTSLVDTRIRSFLKNKAQLIRNQGVFHSGSSPNNAAPPEILVSRLKKLDWNPGDIARELCMQIISLATSKGFSFPCSSLLISSGLEKKKKRWKNTGYRFPCYILWWRYPANRWWELLPLDLARPSSCGNFQNRAAIFWLCIVRGPQGTVRCFKERVNPSLSDSDLIV